MATRVSGRQLPGAIPKRRPVLLLGSASLAKPPCEVSLISFRPGNRFSLSMKLAPAPDGNQLSRLRAVSRQLLGNKYRLEVALAVADSEGRVYAHAVANSISDLADNQAGIELAHLEDAGLLAREAPTEGQTRIYFQRRPSCYWTHCEELATEILNRGPRLVEPDSRPS